MNIQVRMQARQAAQQLAMIKNQIAAIKKASSGGATNKVAPIKFDTSGAQKYTDSITKMNKALAAMNNKKKITLGVDPQFNKQLDQSINRLKTFQSQLRNNTKFTVQANFSGFNDKQIKQAQQSLKEFTQQTKSMPKVQVQFAKLPTEELKKVGENLTNIKKQTKSPFKVALTYKGLSQGQLSKVAQNLKKIGDQAKRKMMLNLSINPNSKSQIQSTMRQLDLLESANKAKRINLTIDPNSLSSIQKAKQQLAKLDEQINKTGNDAAKASKKIGGMTTSDVGNKMQWTGRMLEYNFTLPLVAAGTAATKFELDNEKAFTQLQKVYGDASKPVSAYTDELKKLRTAFVLLSDIFGVSQSEVIKIGADWAQAGASGAKLGEAVKLTLQTMILGEMDATKATQSLIAIQGQYHLSLKQLSQAIAVLNMTENETGISMSGLIDVFTRASGAARTAGVDYRHLAAMAAALVPATGSAANAGNALKTILSRLMAPTKDMIDVFGKLGINVYSASWQSKNATQRLEELAKSYKGVNQATQSYVASVLGSRWQVSRFSILMKELTDRNGYYAKSLDATASKTKNYMQMQKELNTVLDSDPQKLQRMWVILQNAMAQIIQPLLPSIVMLAQALAGLAQKFANLDPGLQKLILFGLLALAAVGPILRYTGAVVTLFGEAGKAVKFFGNIGGKVLDIFKGGLTKMVPSLEGIGARIVPALTNPYVLAVAAIIALLLVFHKQIAQIFQAIWKALDGSKVFQGIVNGVRTFSQKMGKYIMDGINSLPNGMRNALLKVLSVVTSAVKAIWHWLSYLNPFQRHSPSLVDNVKAGMAVIKREYQGARSLTNVFAKSASDLTRFGNAIRTVQALSSKLEFGADRKKVASLAPGALGAFDSLVADYNTLSVAANRYKTVIDAQQQIVDKWTAKLKSANDALDAQQKILDNLNKAQQALQNQYDAAKDKLSSYTDAQITGEQAMSDAIFANDQAQKALQLQILKTQDAMGGKTLDDYNKQLQGINQTIDDLTKSRTDLQQGGAGSDILKAYDDQIAKLKDSASGINQQAGPLQNLQNQLDKLKNTADELDLEQSLQFDPLHRQIDQLANGIHELPFDEIIAGVKSSKDEMAKLQPQLDAVNAKIADQQKVVDKLTDARDAIQASYDKENDKLQTLQDKYSKIQDKMSDIKSAISDLTSAYDDLKKSAGSAADKMFDAASAASDYGDVGGNFSTKGLQGGDLDQFIKDLNKDLAKQLGSFDMFGPIKKKWKQFTGWLGKVAGPVFKPIGDAWHNMIESIQNSSLLKNIGKMLKPIADYIGKVVGKLGDLFGPEVRDYIKQFGEAFSDAYKQIKPELDEFKKYWPQIKKGIEQAIATVAPAAAVFAGIIAGVILLLASIYTHIFIGVIKPIINMIAGILGGIIRNIRGFIEIFTGLITGDWALAWKGVTDVVSGTWKIIYNIIWGAAGIIKGIVWGFISGIVDFFKWLYDVLVGHSIVPDLINSIIRWFKSVVKPIKDIWDAVWGWIKKAWAYIVSTVWNGVQSVGRYFTNLYKNMKNTAYNIYSYVTGKIRDAMNTAASIVNSVGKRMSSSFTGLKNNIGKIWDGVKAKVKAPVNFFIDPVYNTGIRGVWNNISALFGGKKLATMNKFAGGGVWDATGKNGLTIPGYNPGQDTEMVLMSRGEGVLVPEAVRNLGGAQGINKINRYYTNRAPGTRDLNGVPKFDGGGVLGWIKNKVGSIKDWALGGMAEKAQGIINGLADKIPGKSRYVGLMRDGVKNIGKMFYNWTHKQEKNAMSGNWTGTITPSIARGQAFVRAQAGKPYIWASAGPTGYDCSGIVSAVWNIMHGKNPYHHTFSTSNEANYFPKHGWGMFTAGWANPGERGGGSVGHTAGNLAGLGFESNGVGGLHVGKSALTPNAFAHVGHYDKGGWMMPGGLGINKTVSPEPVFTSTQWNLLERAVSTVFTSRSAFAKAEAKFDSSGQAVTHSSSGDTIININGDLVMPNITSPEDADKFVKNLMGIAASGRSGQ